MRASSPILAWMLALASLAPCTALAGTPYGDSRHPPEPQAIPGAVQCAYYDVGGEGVAYHTVDKVNQGSGRLNPANGSYLNEFRKDEAIGTSYTKFHTIIDNSPYDVVQPPESQLYVGWTTPGEWFNITVNVREAGTYKVSLLYTSNRGGQISLDLAGKPLVPACDIISTWNAAETIPWRQWHHWNKMIVAPALVLPKGVNVLTVHILTQGNMNLAYFDFRPTS
ncbi:MAG TPA: hypothetical protein VFE25_14510 [Opitutaceae bacterium]|nr:hypothetical protein [Opitutaceae bacterium]